MKIENIWVRAGRQLFNDTLLLRVTTRLPNRSFFLAYSERGLGGPDWSRMVAMGGPNCMAEFIPFLQRELAAAEALKRELPVASVLRARARARASAAAKAKAKAKARRKPARRGRRAPKRAKPLAVVERQKVEPPRPCHAGAFFHIFRKNPGSFRPISTLPRQNGGEDITKK